MTKLNTLQQLIDQAEGLGVSIRALGFKAEVDRMILYNWKLGHTKPNQVDKWMGVINQTGISVPEPGVATVSLVGYKAFLTAGYNHVDLYRVWKTRDAQIVENYKKAFHALEKIKNPNALQKSENKRLPNGRVREPKKRISPWD